MQPNRAATPWGAMSTLVTAAVVLATMFVGLVLLAAVFGSGGTDDGSMDGHACVTIDRSDELTDSDFGRDGSLRTATSEQTVCRSHEALGRPRVVQAVADSSPLPAAVAVLGLLIGLRRVVEGTRDDGPFSTEAAYRLRRLRPWATSFVLAGFTASWALSGVANDLVADESWPDGAGMLWPSIVTYLALTLFARVCEFGTAQRMAAFDRGQTTARLES